MPRSESGVAARRWETQPEIKSCALECELPNAGGSPLRLHNEWENVMSEESKIDPRHDATRRVLRTAGPILAGVGLLFIVIGVANFFSAFGTFEPPRYFWCAFV